MSEGKRDAILGTVKTARTLVDGGMTVTIEISGADMNDAFALFGRPGTQVGIARIVQAVAQSHQQKEAIRTMAEGRHGKSWATLYRFGFWNNPRVVRAFEAGNIDPEDRPEFIKTKIREDFGVESTADISPDAFHGYLLDLGIADTLPREFGA